MAGIATLASLDHGIAYLSALPAAPASRTPVWQSLFQVLREEADCDDVDPDSASGRARQHAAGAAKKKEQALGRARGGPRSQIQACVASQGQLARFSSLPGSYTL